MIRRSLFSLILIAAVVFALRSSTIAQVNLVLDGSFSQALTDNWEVSSMNAAVVSGQLHIAPTQPNYQGYRNTYVRSNVFDLAGGHQYKLTFWYSLGDVGSVGVNIRQEGQPFQQVEDAIAGATVNDENTNGYIEREFRPRQDMQARVYIFLWNNNTVVNLDNISVWCVDVSCDSPTPTPTHTLPPGTSVPAPYPTQLPQPGQPTITGCVGRCGSVPWPVPQLPGLLTPTPISGGGGQPTDDNGNGGSGVIVDAESGTGNTPTPYYDGLQGPIDDIGDLATGTLTVPGDGEISEEVIYDLVDDTELWIAYTKGLFETEPFGPFQPVVAVLLLAITLSLVYYIARYALPLLAIIVGLIRKIYGALMDALPL